MVAVSREGDAAVLASQIRGWDGRGWDGHLADSCVWVVFCGLRGWKVISESTQPDSRFWMTVVGGEHFFFFLLTAANYCSPLFRCARETQEGLALAQRA